MTDTTTETRTPATELRDAAKALRCDHSFPCQPPHGSIARPGDCTKCGVPYDNSEPVADHLREPIADWLEEQARQYDLPPCNDPTGVCNRCEWDPSVLAAESVARAINGKAA